MRNSALKVSENFRKMAVRSVLSIVLFLFTYLFLIVLGIGLILLCGLIAYGLMVLKFMGITLMIGIGFIGMGFMIFFFLIKFIFSSSKKVDRSHLLEVTEKEQPELFTLIREIVKEVKTSFPKQVYLSSEVNASVFYDSNFWSMFFPVRKNLQIGIGLMNSVSTIELKAILAHEFGHFSQRSMKVGSYVYNVNKVIYNMLYDNDNYSALLDHWSNISSYFIFFSKGAILVIRGIQYVLIKVYKILNLNYMALSREMEFHADAVAASVTGSAPLCNSLLRLELANQSLSVIFDYYNGKISASQKTKNFYPQQYFVLNHIAENENLPIQDGLPEVSLESYNKVNKTKLVLDDQWSSHPGTEERVARLMNLNLPTIGEYGGIAIDILKDKELIQEKITSRIFEDVEYTNDPDTVGSKDFIDEFLKLEQENSYPKFYKGFFNFRIPYVGFTINDFESTAVADFVSIEEVINDEVIGSLTNMSNAISDRDILRRISEGELEVKTFDYEGKKYSVADTYTLIGYLDEEIKKYEDILKKKDVLIFEYFLNNALIHGHIEGFKNRSIAYQELKIQLDMQQEVFRNLSESTAFIHKTTPFDDIINNMLLVKKFEMPFKEQIKLMLESDIYKESIDIKMKEHFEEYIGNDWIYFANSHYFDKELDSLFTVLSDYYSLVYQVHFKVKKDLLEFNLTLIPESESNTTVNCN